MMLPVPPPTEYDAFVGEIEKLHATTGSILLIVPPSPTTYNSPCSSSPNEEMLSAVSSSQRLSAAVPRQDLAGAIVAVNVGSRRQRVPAIRDRHTRR